MKSVGAPTALLVGIAAAVLAVVLIDPLGAGLAGGVLALFGFAALGVGGHEPFDEDATLTGVVVGAIALIAAQAGRVTWLRAPQE